MADQYPAARCRIKLRIEDYGDESPPPITPWAGPGPAGFGLGGRKEVSPSDFAVTCDFQPRSFVVELNSPRKADTARVTFSRESIPVDPQVLRAATLQVFCGAVTPEEFAEANYMPGQTGLWLPDVVPPGWVGAGETWEIFRGFIDEWEADYDEDEISIRARDTTGFLIDGQVPENALRGVPKTARIDEAIRMMIDGDPKVGVEGFPGAKGLVVVTETSRPVPRLSEFLAPNWFDARGKVTKGRKKKPKEPKQMSWWDQITDLCVSAGLKAYMRQPRKAVNIAGIGVALPASEIVICDANTYYAGGGRRRVFAHGINAEGLKVSRKFGGTPVPYVEVRSWDPVAGKQVIGRYPGPLHAGVAAPAVKGKPAAGGPIDEKMVAEIVALAAAVAVAAAGGASAAEVAAATATALAVAQGAKAGIKAAQDAATQAAIDAADPGRASAAASAAATASGLPPVAAALAAAVAATEAARVAKEKAALKKSKGGPSSSNKPTATGAGDRKEYQVFTIDSLSGPNAGPLADEIARSFYEQLGRGEFDVRLATVNMNAMPENAGNPRSADMLLLRPGETITVLGEPNRRGGDVATREGAVRALGRAEMVEMFVRAGFPQEAAVRLARAQLDPRVQRDFRVQTLIVEFDAGEGLRFQIEAQSFLDARYKAS